MLIIHRYLLRQFVQVFVICFCSLMGLYVVIDAFGNLEEFVNFGDKHGGMLAAILRYYGPRCLPFFDNTSGIVTLIAAMFTLATFQRFNELTALQAAGIPKWKIIKPIAWAAIVVALLAVVNRELLIPAFRDNLSRDVHDLAGDRAKELHLIRDHTTDVLIHGKQTIARTQQIKDPNFQPPASWGAPFKQLQAVAAFYMPADPGQNRPAGYWFKGMTQPRDLARRPSLPRSDPQHPQPHVLLTPLDYKWLAADECFVVSDITFEQLEGSDAWRRLNSTWGLIGAYQNSSLGQTADMAVSIHARILQPLLDVTLLLLGLPLILRRYNRNIFVAIGQCVLVVVGFYLVTSTAQYLGSAYLGTPDLAAWLPLLIFVPLATGMSEPLRE